MGKKSQDLNKSQIMFGNRAKVGGKKAGGHRRDPSQATDSEALFSSDGDHAPEQIDQIYYDEFITKEDFDEEMDATKGEMKDEILDEAKALVHETTQSVVAEQVEVAQMNMG